MVRITSALIAIVASSLSLVAAQSYQDFTADATKAIPFADRAAGFGSQVVGGVAEGKSACDARDNCLGVICSSASNVCVPFRYDANGVTDTGAGGFDSIHYRYNTPEGPACRAALGDEFTSAEGQCTCGSDLERQNTAFGCILAISPSQAPLRRRIANNRIMPGHAARAVFERRRTRQQTGNALV